MSIRVDLENSSSTARQLIADLIVDYVRHIRSAAGYSRTTAKAYQSQLRRFDRWATEQLGRAPLLGDVTAKLLRAYVMELSESGCRPRTVRSAVMPLRSLFNYLVETDALEVSPVHAVRLPKKDAAQRPRVTEEELIALVEGCDRLAGTERSAMARALVLTLITTALRRSELLGLRVGDVNLEAEQVVVASGKGSKSRAVFLPEETAQALATWLELRPACRHDHLFIVDTNRRLGNEGLDRLLDEVKAAAGLRSHDNIQPHAVRHAAATRLLRRGADLKSLQTLLGHANISTTAVYLHTDEEQLRSVARLASVHKTPPAAEQQPEDTLLVPQCKEAEVQARPDAGRQERTGGHARQERGLVCVWRARRRPPERTSHQRARRPGRPLR